MYTLHQVLVCADGATSKLATQLGIVSRPPDSSCSRAYVEGGTHKFKADGVVFYNPELLPGQFSYMFCSSIQHLDQFIVKKIKVSQQSRV